MAHHDAPVSRITAGRHYCAAISRRVSGRNLPLVFVEPWHVIVRKLFQTVERYDVPAISLYSHVIEAPDNCIEFTLVLSFNLRPEQVLSRLAIKVPVSPAFVLQKGFSDTKNVFDLFGEQLAVLISDLFRRSFEMHVDPSVSFESIASF